MQLRTLLSLFLLTTLLPIHAQESEKPANKSKKMEPIVVNLTADRWLNAPKGITFNGLRSRGFGFNMMSDKQLGSSGLSFRYGLGISSHSIDSDVDWSSLTVDSVENTSSYTFDKLPSKLEYKKNRFVTSFIEIPLEFLFRAKPEESKNSFKIGAGLTLGYLLSSHTKYKDDENKSKDYYLKDLSPFQYGATARIGYGRTTLYGYYPLSKVFSEGVGKDIQAFSVGLSIMY